MNGSNGSAIAPWGEGTKSPAGSAADLKPYPAMRDSGVPWLGEVPEHWGTASVKRQYAIQLGKMLQNRPEGPTDTEVAYLKAQHVQWFSVLSASPPKMWASPRDRTQFGITAGDLLVCEGGEGGRSGVVREIPSGLIIQNALHRVRPHAGCLNEYLQYVMSAVATKGWFDAINNKATIAHFTREKFGALGMPVPATEEQAAIVRFLDHADRRIRRYIGARQKLIKLLEEQKQAIIHRAVTRGLDPNVRLKPSGVEWLGDVPEHWEVTRLGRLIELMTGFPFKSDGFTQGAEDIRLLRGINISPGRIRWTDVVRWPRSERDEYSAFDLQVGDIVLGMDRPIIQSGTRVATVNVPDVPALLLQRVARIRPRRELHGEFLSLLLAGKSFADYLTPIFTGISVPHLSPEQIKSFRLGLPTCDEQRQIVRWAAEKTSETSAAVVSAEREISLLREYRTRLIADVVTGKLDAREAAASLPDESLEPEALDEERYDGSPEAGEDDEPGEEANAV